MQSPTPMPTHPDITSRADIITSVDAFYADVRADPLIGPVFLARFGTDGWSDHLAQMYQFWDTLLFHNPGYKGSPFRKHASLPIEKRHFDRWVELFVATIDARFAGPVAEDAKQRARILGLTFESKLRHLRAGGIV